MRLADGPQRHPRLQQEGTRRAHARLPATQARVCCLVDEESAEALREMLHRSPREFRYESSLWTLEMAAEVAFAEGLTERRLRHTEGRLIMH